MCETDFDDDGCVLGLFIMQLTIIGVRRGQTGQSCKRMAMNVFANSTRLSYTVNLSVIWTNGLPDDLLPQVLSGAPSRRICKSLRGRQSQSIMPLELE